MSYMLIDRVFAYGAIVFDSRRDSAGGHLSDLSGKEPL